MGGDAVYGTCCGAWFAGEQPWGDSNSFDCVVGRPGKFVAVQVKSTVAKLESGKGYICSTCSSHKAYRAGAFDFIVAYVVPEDAWYIIPAKEIRGLKSISLCTQSGEGKYEEYREAWSLLREARGLGRLRPRSRLRAELNTSPAGGVPASGVERIQAAMNFFRRQLERGSISQKVIDKLE